MTISIASDLTAVPCSNWASEDQFQCNEKTRCGGSPCPDGYVSPWTADDWLTWSTSLLFNLTGRRFSVCAQTITPSVVCPCTLPPVDCSTCDVCTACGRYPVIDLGVDVVSVASVVVDGATLDPSLYRIDDHRWLVRVANPDGSNPGWTRTQRYDLNSGVGTFTVTYSTGIAPPPGAAQACVALACVLRSTCDGPGNVGALKGQSVTSMTTRGVSAQTEGLMKGLRDGKSGIGAVDAFFAIWHVPTRDAQGHDIARGGAVWSPELDDDAPKRTTWLA